MKTQEEFKQFIKVLGYDEYAIILEESTNILTINRDIKFSDLGKIKEFLQVDDFKLDGPLCSPIETGELKMKREEYEKGYDDGFNDKACKSKSSKEYIKGYDEGKYQKLESLPGKIFKRDYLI